MKECTICGREYESDADTFFDICDDCQRMIAKKGDSK